MVEAVTLKLSYQADAAVLFEQIRHLPWAQLLDSCNHHSANARYDILVAAPLSTLITQNGITRHYDSNNKPLATSADAFGLLKQAFAALPDLHSDLPFCGGAVGYWGYDLVNISEVEDSRPALQDLPDMAVGLYDWAVISDHETQTTCLVGHSEQQLQHWLAIFNAQPASSSKTALQVKQLKVDKDFTNYVVDFKRIQNYLREGDCYQVNYARCFKAECQGDSWSSYRQIRQNNPVPFGAYLQLPFAEVLCCSPERFIHIDDNKVLTSPIKGTRPRKTEPANDLQSRNELSLSSKDRAENLMIVDLLRNDLGKSCEPGSIQVPALFEIETFPTVFHMVSHIIGDKREDVSAVEVFQRCFPGGSVTGAPKKRAMQIIQELESAKRQLYCGAIGYISTNGRLDSNITIRTMTVVDQQLVFWAGGGIVADSVAEDEFAETEDKARAFFNLLGIKHHQ